MNDYEALDLTTFCNVGVEVLEPPDRPPLGALSLHGLPFLVGGPQPDPGRCFLAFGAGVRSEALRLPIGRRGHSVIFAHRLLADVMVDRFLATTYWHAGSPGEPVAEYRVHLSGGSMAAQPIRNRFEIDVVPAIGGGPFRAVEDQAEELLPREAGRFELAGIRQAEASRGGARWFVLWTWRNPAPDQVIEALEIVPAGPRFIVAAVTLGHVDEWPFTREAASDVIVRLPRPEDAGRPFDMRVEVDRGAASYAYALPGEPAEEGSLPGWGAPQSRSRSSAYVRVAAVPSATLVVKQGTEILGAARWGDLQTAGRLRPSERLQLELVDRGRNWVHTRVVDDASGQPLPCRVHFATPEGIPYPPHGHHAHVNSNLGAYFVDVGGDVRLGQMTYAYIDGTCQGWLPRGEVVVEAARGFEYEPLRARVRIEPGQQHLELRLRRWRDMNVERWFSGDTHVHFLSTQGGHLEARGEGLNVVNVLQAQWGHLFSSTEEFSGRPSVAPDGRSIVYVSQENRQHLLGHLSLLGLKQPVMPWSSDGLPEAELGGALETTLAHWADACRAQGGTVILPHFPFPNGEPAALIATGRTDAVEMVRHAPHLHDQYYRYLNCGYRLPLAGGTDKMSSDVPVGLYRTYVYIPAETPFDYDNWCRGLAAGRTFISSGPLLRLGIEGAAIGDTLRLPAGGGTLTVTAEAQSALPIHSLEIVLNGRVVARTEATGGARRLSVEERVRVTGHSWLAARCAGPGYWHTITHHDQWHRGLMAHTSPVYVACGEDWWMFDASTVDAMLVLVGGSLEHVRHGTHQHRPGTVTHHHGQADHLAFLERPFLEAQQILERRLRAGR